MTHPRNMHSIYFHVVENIVTIPFAQSRQNLIVFFVSLYKFVSISTYPYLHQVKATTNQLRQATIEYNIK